MTEARKRMSETAAPDAGRPTIVIELDPRLEEAIQSGCGSLLALEASLASVEGVPGEHGRAERALRDAMELVKSSIAELQQLMPVADRSQLALGFVASGPGRRRRARPITGSVAVEQPPSSPSAS
jgi:hypothetical protein